MNTDEIKQRIESPPWWEQPKDPRPMAVRLGEWVLILILGAAVLYPIGGALNWAHHQVNAAVRALDRSAAAQLRIADAAEAQVFQLAEIDGTLGGAFQGGVIEQIEQDIRTHNIATRKRR